MINMSSTTHSIYHHSLTSLSRYELLCFYSFVMNVADLEVQLLQRIEGNSRGFRDKEKFQLFLIHPSVIYIIFIDPRKE